MLQEVVCFFPKIIGDDYPLLLRSSLLHRARQRKIKFICLPWFVGCLLMLTSCCFAAPFLPCRLTGVHQSSSDLESSMSLPVEIKERKRMEISLSENMEKWELENLRARNEKEEGRSSSPYSDCVWHKAEKDLVRLSALLVRKWTKSIVLVLTHILLFTKFQKL